MKGYQQALPVRMTRVLYSAPENRFLTSHRLSAPAARLLGQYRKTENDDARGAAHEPVPPVWWKFADAALAGSSVLITALWPALLDVVVLAIHPEWSMLGSKDRSVAVVAEILCIMLCALSWYFWTMAIPAATAVEGLVGVDDHDRLQAWIMSRLNRATQCVIGVAVSLLFEGVLAVEYFADLHRPPSATLYVTAGWLGFVGGLVFYWLIVAAEFPGLLSKLSLRLVWLDPAGTPTVRTLCRVYWGVAFATLIGLVYCEFGVALTFGSTASSIGLAGGFMQVFPVVAGVFTVYVGLRPFVLLARLIRGHIDRLTELFIGGNPSTDLDWLTSPDFPEAVTVYQHVSSLKALPVSSLAFVQYVAGVVASLALFVIQHYAK
jgi:hypothetical protein